MINLFEFLYYCLYRVFKLVKREEKDENVATWFYSILLSTNIIAFFFPLKFIIPQGTFTPYPYNFLIKIILGSIFPIWYFICKYDYINFSKSLFYHGNSLLGKKFVQFNNAEEFVKAMSEEIVRPERLCVVKELDYTLDYIHFRVSSEIFVSKELKETLEIAGLTGIKFVEAKEPELYFEE